MTPTHLHILRTIATHQPILKDELYRSISEYSPYTLADCLSTLHDMGYVQYGRHKGPIWLTLLGSETIDKNL